MIGAAPKTQMFAIQTNPRTLETAGLTVNEKLNIKQKTLSDAPPVKGGQFIQY